MAWGAPSGGTSWAGRVHRVSRASSFNVVVQTNKGAVHLWQPLGFGTGASLGATPSGGDLVSRSAPTAKAFLSLTSYSR
jgi:hypothetical protein